VQDSLVFGSVCFVRVMMETFENFRQMQRFVVECVVDCAPYLSMKDCSFVIFVDWDYMMAGVGRLHVISVIAQPGIPDC